MTTTQAIVTIEKVYSDASGAPATVIVDGFYFSADCVGEIRLNGLTNRAAPKRVIKRAYAAYAARLRQLVTETWFENNRKFYATEGDRLA